MGQDARPLTHRLINQVNTSRPVKQSNRPHANSPGKRFEMKGILCALFLIACVSGAHHKRRRDEDIRMNIHEARVRIKQDFERLWNNTHEAATNSHYDMLKLYTESTLEQAKEAVLYVAQYANMTRTETTKARWQPLEPAARLVALDCINHNEINTVKAYKMTGFNLHQCIKTAQMHVETMHQERLKQFHNILREIPTSYERYARQLDNCVDAPCVMATVINSVVEHERIMEHVATNVTEMHNLSTRYMLNNVAVGCVASSLLQLQQNFETGKNLVEGCTAPKQATQTP